MPSVLRDAKACKPTKPLPRYISDGSGRDVIIAFSGMPNPPNFNHISKNRPHHLPSKLKGGNAKIPVTPKFIPDGSGRDLFQQQNTDYVCPTRVLSSAIGVTPKRRVISNYSRPKVNARFKPSGSGRDMGYTDIDVYQTINSQNSFKVLKPSASNAQILRPRTSPPPRFQSSGSGRDTYQNPSAHRPASSYNPQREGFKYGSQSISRNARYKYGGNATKSYAAQNETMKRLCTSTRPPPPRAKSASAVRTSRNNNNNDSIAFDEYFS